VGRGSGSKWQKKKKNTRKKSAIEDKWGVTWKKNGNCQTHAAEKRAFHLRPRGGGGDGDQIKGSSQKDPWGKPFTDQTGGGGIDQKKKNTKKKGKKERENDERGKTSAPMSTKVAGEKP